MKISTHILTLASVAGFATNVFSQVLKTPERKGCYAAGGSLKDQGSYQYQTDGWCQNHTVVDLQKPVFALTGGSNCWAGDELPPKDKLVGDENCQTPCQGFPGHTCGGDKYWEVFLSGTKASVGTAGGGGSSSSSITSANSGTPTKSASPSTITEAGQTIVVTANSQTDAPATANLKNKSSGPNKAAIAAGVIVGLLAIVAIAVAAFFFLRSRKRRAVEEEYRRNAAISNMNGKPGSHSSLSDSRLEPSVMLQRRMSDGSIADNQDYSRRILKVTNPDGK